jgi:hypothetical protein
MQSPAPNIPGAISAVSTFTEYLNELKATSIDDIRELDEITNALFAREDASIHVLGVGGGSALAGRMAAQPQGGDLTAARAMAAILCSMGGCTNFFVDDGIVEEIVDQLKSETANPLPPCVLDIGKVRSRRTSIKSHLLTSKNMPPRRSTPASPSSAVMTPAFF